MGRLSLAQLREHLLDAGEEIGLDCQVRMPKSEPSRNAMAEPKNDRAVEQAIRTAGVIHATKHIETRPPPLEQETSCHQPFFPRSYLVRHQVFSFHSLSLRSRRAIVVGNSRAT